MSGLRLITSLTSPFGRIPRMLALEHGLDIEIVEETPWKSRANITPHNPVGKVPILLLDDGTPIIDSWVIAEHLDSLGDRPLLPADGLPRLKMQSSCALCHDILGVSVIVVAAQLLNAPVPDKVRDFYLDKAEAGLAAVAARLGDGEFGGDGHNMVDIAAVAVLGFIEFRLKDARNWRGDAPALFDWFDEATEKWPAARETVPPSPS